MNSPTLDPAPQAADTGRDLGLGKRRPLPVEGGSGQGDPPPRDLIDRTREWCPPPRDSPEGHRRTRLEPPRLETREAPGPSRRIGPESEEN